MSEIQLDCRFLSPRLRFRQTQTWRHVGEPAHSGRRTECALVWAAVELPGGYYLDIDERSQGRGKLPWLVRIAMTKVGSLNLYESLYFCTTYLWRKQCQLLTCSAAKCLYAFAPSVQFYIPPHGALRMGRDLVTVLDPYY